MIKKELNKNLAMLELSYLFQTWQRASFTVYDNRIVSNPYHIFILSMFILDIFHDIIVLYTKKMLIP